MKQERLTVRIPIAIYKRLKAEKKRKQHLSLNAVIIESLARGLDLTKEKASA